MAKVTLQIDGMSCGHCLNAVNRALHEVKGAEVKQVQMGRAEIEVATPEVVSALEQAIADAGYRATVVSGG